MSRYFLPSRDYARISSVGVPFLFLTSQIIMSPASTGGLSPIALIGFIGALVALLMVGGAGPAYRLNLVDLGGAFSLLRWGAWTGLVVAFIALVGAWITRPGTQRRGLGVGFGGVVLGGR